jgi:glutamyl-tRNA reductase
MLLSVIGVNHRTASVEVREKLAVSDAVLPQALRELAESPGVDEVALLSTCNRTEIYSIIDNAEQRTVASWLGRFHGMQLSDLEAYLFECKEVDAVRHVLRVAAGLDSMVLGEPQILGQLKDAYKTAVDQHVVGKRLNKLFQHAFHVAKRIRTDTEIGSSPVSVAFAAVRLAQQIHGDLNRCTALLIGAGDTIELTANHLAENGLARLIVANRTIERAQSLAGKYGGFAIQLDDLGRHLAEADIVVSATASSQPIVHRETVEQAIKARRRRPVFMVDIAVPRDIEPSVSTLPDVYLYSVDDLQAVVQNNIRSREVAATQANEIVASQANRYLDWLKTNDATNTIQEMRLAGDTLRQQLLTQARQRLANGEDPEEVLNAVTNLLVNKLMHNPTVRLRDAGANGHEEFIAMARTLFDLD